MNVSIMPELTEAEAALTALAKAVERKTKTEELRNDYYGLLQQAGLALNKMRAMTETRDFLRNFGSKSEGD